MRKITVITCAALLTSVAFTGCKGDQNAPEQNVQNVATDITIALPAQVSGPNKMPSATVQWGGVTDFETNGMKDIVLIPFAKSKEIEGTDKRLGDKIELGNIGDTYTYATDNGGRTKVFENKPVPAGTGAFLFYAESGADNASFFNSGKLTANYSSVNPKDYEFYLSPIQENASTVTGHDAYAGLLAYMNLVANAVDGNGKKWCKYTSSDNAVGLYDLFQLYAGAKVLSSFGIARMMNDLYKTLEPLASVDTVLAQNIRAAIVNSTYAEITDGVVTLKSTIAGFPESVSLPDGALAVAWNSAALEGNGAFEGNGASVFGSLNPANISQYAYPASLWYYANSKIKTSTASEKEHYSGAADWAAILGQYPTDNATVNTATRSIALKDEVQYGVARLDVQLKAAETLEDNNTNVQANKITNTTGYELTGVLVGGQQAVGFDFTRASYPVGGTHNAIYTIYDKVMSQTVYATVADYSSNRNSTLVLESANGQDVYIAIELRNNSGKDFYGVEHQMIPAGGKFYLVGKLPAATTVNAGANATAGYVFKQDFTTTAKLTIGDLKSAYNTIPDLKAPNVEIGFAVNLEWRAGNVYTVTL